MSVRRMHGPSVPVAYLWVLPCIGRNRRTDIIGEISIEIDYYSRDPEDCDFRMPLHVPFFFTTK